MCVYAKVIWSWLQVLAENAKLQETVSEYAVEVARLHSENQRLQSTGGSVTRSSSSGGCASSIKTVYEKDELLK